MTLTTTSLSALLLALLAVAALLVLLAITIVLRRGWRQAVLRRAAARSEPVRPVLLSILGGDEADTATLHALASLDKRTWTVIEPTVVSLLGKVRGTGREALVELLAARGVHDRAMSQASSRSAVRRCRAAELLGSLATPESVSALVVLLADPDAEVRLVAARALGRAEDPFAADALLASLTGPRAVPQRVVARSLARLGAGAEPALIEALRHPEPWTRAVAAEILGLVGAVRAVPALASAVRDEDADEVRIRAARALGRLGLPGCAPALLSAVEAGGPPALRAVATRALGDVGGETVVTALTGLLGDPDHQVAHNAGAALARLGPSGVRALQSAGNHPDSVEGPDPAAAHAREALAHAGLRGLVPADVAEADEEATA